MISCNKFIDVVGLHENYLICIFMNINKIVDKRGNEGKAITIARFLMGYKIYLDSLTPIFMTNSVVRETLCHKILSSVNIFT